MHSLLIPEPPLQVLPSLATAIGLNEAIFLQQLHYWLQRSGKERDGHLWIYNSYANWREQFPFWSEKTIRRIVSNLRKQNIIQTTSEYNKLGIDNTLWYAIDYDHVPSADLGRPSGQVVQTTRSSCPDHAVKLSTPITRDYTETTTESTDVYDEPPPASPDTTDVFEEMVDLVCQLCGWDRSLLLGKEEARAKRVASKLLHSNYTKDDLSKFMPAVWYRDWRWQKNKQLPMPEDILRGMGQLRSDMPVSPAAQTSKVDRNMAIIAEYIHNQGELRNARA